MREGHRDLKIEKQGVGKIWVPGVLVKGPRTRKKNLIEREGGEKNLAFHRRLEGEKKKKITGWGYPADLE